MNKEFIIECVKNNRKIDAIKYVRNETGLGLKQAVEYVEQIIEEYRDTSIMQQGCIFKDEELFEPAVELILAEGKITTAMLQRTFRIGYNRTAQLVDMLERQGIISAANGSKPRKALISKSEWLLLKYELNQGAKVGR